MTLAEAKANVGGLAVLHMQPPDSARRRILEQNGVAPEPIDLYAQILATDERGIWVMLEDWSRWLLRPGDGYTEALELVEPPRRAAGVQRRE